MVETFDPPGVRQRFDGEAAGPEAEKGGLRCTYTGKTNL